MINHKRVGDADSSTCSHFLGSANLHLSSAEAKTPEHNQCSSLLPRSDPKRMSYRRVLIFTWVNHLRLVLKVATKHLQTSPKHTTCKDAVGETSNCLGAQEYQVLIKKSSRVHESVWLSYRSDLPLSIPKESKCMGGGIESIEQNGAW